MTKFWVTVFFGWAGVHKFMERKIGIGLLYFFTFGLFGIGWLLDAAREWTARPQTKSCEVQRASNQKKEETQPRTTNPVAHNDCFMGMGAIQQYEKRFIAFDVETTGFSAVTDRIVEISAVLFENAKPVRSFTSLIQPGMPMPSAASKVNGITDKMLEGAPCEKDVLQNFCEFVGLDALSGDTLLVAHNAAFDIKFLLYACSRCGVTADFSFADTLELSREMISGPENFKLGTLAQYLEIEQTTAHRAEDDARVCGELFVYILQKKKLAFKERFDSLSSQERELCVWYRKLLEDADLNTQLLYFHPGTYFTANCVYTALKAKPKAKRPYVLIEKDVALPDGIQTAPATKSEGEDKVRVFFVHPSDLDPIADVLLEQYKKAFGDAMNYLDGSDRRMKEYAKTMSDQVCV